jgi:hypothetical protein
MRLCHDCQLSADDIEEGRAVWGKSVLQVFKRSQALTGFGAAMGKLRDNEVLGSLSEIDSLSQQLTLGEGDCKDFLLSINQAVKWLNLNTKKIGNAQRMFFYFFFVNFTTEKTIRSRIFPVVFPPPYTKWKPNYSSEPNHSARPIPSLLCDAKR